MTHRTIKLLLILNLLFLAGVLFRPSTGLCPVAAQSPPPALKDNEELARLTQEDQDDRNPPAGKPIDWKVIEPRDRARLARAKELYVRDQLQTGHDYFNAALILQHSELPEDYLLAHELSVVAISKGVKVESLAAASEDRYLMSIGRRQRFGTQYRSAKGGPYRLYPMDTGVTDQLRRLMHVPTLAEAKAGEAEMNKK